MTIINIRGTSGSGKSTLVKRFLDEHPHETIEAQIGPWKKPKIVAYKCYPAEADLQWIKEQAISVSWQLTGAKPTYIIGRYETACGGCDTMSYKGSHDDIEEMVRAALEKGNVIFEGLTISSTLTRWRRIADENPGEFVWAFMDTPVEVCHERILARSGREPKRDSKGLADYQKKYTGCMRHVESLNTDGQRVVMLSSDDEGYRTLLGLLR